MENRHPGTRIEVELKDGTGIDEILGSHGAEYDDGCLLECRTLQSDEVTNVS